MKLSIIYEEIVNLKKASEFTTISQNGAGFIKCKEGFRNKAERDARGFAIGYGTRFTGTNISPNRTISKQQADAYMNQHLRSKVYPYIYNNVKVRITQQQFDALCSLIYNIGGDAFVRSNTLKAINGDKNFKVDKEWLGFNTSAGKPLPGLSQRRKEESDVFTNKKKQFNLAGCIN